MALSYHMTRLLDSFLREDCWGLARSRQVREGWLDLTLRNGRQWSIPVRPGQLQPWRSREAYLVEGGRRLDDPREFARKLAPLVDESQAFLQELDCSLYHHRMAARAWQHWTAQPAPEPATWWESLLHHDRLASFQDHPYYPTARAKLGLDASALRRYAPEFGGTFELEWLRVPRDWQTDALGELPAWWPVSEDLLVPVHPHMKPLLGTPEGTSWEAPRVRVRPTLSVRTVALVDHPEFHLKLPLQMRSLSYKNLRRIKPATIADGHTVQTHLARLLSDDYLLTYEGVGFAVQGRNDLACIVRRYPAERLERCRVLPVAALGARTLEGGTVLESLGPDFLNTYLELTLRLHVGLWVQHGIALEANQQNTLIVIAPDGRVRLMLKDNDAARVRGRWGLLDPCMEVDDWESIAQMFITIALHLNVLPFVEDLEAVTRCLGRILAALPPEQVAASRIRELLLEPERHPVKYLFAAGTLFSKARTGAADINKHYGFTAPNCLR